VFVFLSKILDLAFSPLSWALLFVFASVLLRRRARWSIGLAFAGIALLYIPSTEPVANALAHYAEASAVQSYRPDVTYDAVILLGGSLVEASTRRAGQPEFDASAERFFRAYELLRQGKVKNIVISAGTIDPRPPELLEPNVLGRQLEAWGISKDRIFRETRSRNTHENATFTHTIVHDQGWRSVLIITSAFHMKRSLGCFRAEGMTPDTLPVDFKGEEKSIGNIFSLVESQVVLASMLQQADFSLVPGQQIRPIAQITLRPSGPVMVQLRWRS
jgi:uncharacterized SAM-binding protein YcdF (DUF218 family)